MRIYLRYRYRARGTKRNISYSSDRNDGSRTLELTLQLEREKGGHRDGIPLLLCDPGAIQTHDLQNRNLTLYSLSYGALNAGTKV